MKQTAVEWLEEKWRNYDLNLGKSGFSLFLKQALQMEKEQIMDGFYVGSECNYDGSYQPEQYYNETYKTE